METRGRGRQSALHLPRNGRRGGAVCEVDALHPRPVHDAVRLPLRRSIVLPVDRLQVRPRIGHKDGHSAHMIAEESTAWTRVNNRVRVGEVGSDRKWNMGWVNETLEYFRKDTKHLKSPDHKRYVGLISQYTER